MDRSTQYQHYTEIIDKVLLNAHGSILGIKVMCAVLKYQVNVSLVEMINATLRPSDNYYNGTTWIISHENVPVPDGFNLYMRPLLSDREYLVVDSHGGKKYNQIKSLSKSFNLLTGGKGFLKVRHILYEGPSVESISNRTVPALPEPVKAKLKLKLKLKPRERGWDFFHDPVLKPASNEKDLAHMKRLTMYVCGSNDQFYYTEFEHMEGHDKVICYLTEEKINAMNGKPYYLSWATRKTYIGALCKYLKLLDKDFSSEMYERYAFYAEQVKVHLLASKSDAPPVAEFTTFLPKLRQFILDTTKVAGFRILCSMIVHVTDTRVLRMTDVQHTRFINDGEHSCIDMDTQTWHIIKPVKQLISLPVDFISDIRTIYGPSLPERLLVDKSGTPYVKMCSLSNMFQRFAKVKYTTICASHTAYHQNETCEK